MLVQDVANELMREMQTKPDLIIGNYSDGNLVATLLAHKLGVTQVCFVVTESLDIFICFQLEKLLINLLYEYSAPLPMLWRKQNTPTQTYIWTNSTANTISHANSLLTLLP
jgi:hypothetical protein